MGEAPLPSEHVLIILNYELSDSLLEAIRQKFADVETTIFPSIRGSKVPRGKLWPRNNEIHGS